MRFQLTQPHYMNDRLLDGGEIIGDDTSNPLPKDFKPSLHMAPLDADAEKAVKDWTERHKRGNPIERLPTSLAPPVDENADRGKLDIKYDTVRPATVYDEGTLVERARAQVETDKQARNPEAVRAAPVTPAPVKAGDGPGPLVEPAPAPKPVVAGAPKK